PPWQRREHPIQPNTSQLAEVVPAYARRPSKEPASARLLLHCADQIGDELRRHAVESQDPEASHTGFYPIGQPITPLPSKGADGVRVIEPCQGHIHLRLLNAWIEDSLHRGRAVEQFGVGSHHCAVGGGSVENGI